ncbi:ImmA/IrrE family metallo-endopeptidase [Kribbella monticola]|uniref:ImmA/IrrE family metallo-endopeptidase n=1 Tax=Kribbella monticola TaxID=2185285 RepID=UPI000DD30869|nr:ImmA/IrrE family metallo-endopeptidase [Kribbella monticola]
MNAEDQGRSRAEAFRKEHRLGHVPLPDLVSLIELTQDIDVAVLAAEPDEHGMTVRDPIRDVVMVAVATTCNPVRQRSTLAHELGHVLFADFAAAKAGGWSDRKPEEIRADAFARHLLVPIPGIEAVLAERTSNKAIGDSKRGTKQISLPELSMIVQRFKASPSLVAIQLYNGGWIGATQKKDWMTLSTPTLASRFGWSDLYHGWQQESETRRAPQRLLSRAIQGYVANVVSLAAVARLRDLPVEQVQAEFELAGIVPDPIEPIGALAGTADMRRPDTDFSDLDALDGVPADPWVSGRDRKAPQG